jgi:hypothetical protein
MYFDRPQLIDERMQVMATVQEVTITPETAESGETIRHNIRASVEVAGEIGTYEFTDDFHEFHDLVHSLLDEVHKAALRHDQGRMQHVLDAEEAFREGEA